MLSTDNLDAAKTVAERIRTNVSNLPWEETGLKVTVSIGLVHSNTIGGEELLRHADMQLYNAKALGKNQTSALEI